MAGFMCTNEYTSLQFQRAIDRFVAVGGERAIPVAIFGVQAEYVQASFDQMQ